MTYTIQFGADYDEDVFRVKGFYPLTVEFQDGRCVELFFKDVFNMQRDLNEVSSRGGWNAAEPGLIIVREVTRRAIEQTVAEMVASGYFVSTNKGIRYR